MRRRQFLTLLGVVLGWPAEVLAQKSDRLRRIGSLMAFTADDAAGLRRARVFKQTLQDLGWTEGGPPQFADRHSSASPADAVAMKRCAQELVVLQPDVILASSTLATAALLQQTRTLPIVFAAAGDPIGSGF